MPPLLPGPTALPSAALLPAAYMTPAGTPLLPGPTLLPGSTLLPGFYTPAPTAPPGYVHDIPAVEIYRRGDGIAWVSITAELVDGPTAFTQTIAFTPPLITSTTPVGVPIYRPLTLTGVPVETGRFRFYQTDAFGQHSPYSDTVDSPALDGGASAWAPTTAEVAKLVAAYARERVIGYESRSDNQQVGRELPDFTAETRPTRTQVTAFIDGAVEEIVGRVGIDPLPDRYGVLKAARQAAIWHAAAQVEAFRAPAQVDDASGTYRAFLSNYTSTLAQTVDQARRTGYALRLT